MYGIKKRFFLRCVVIRLFQVITQTVNSLYKSHSNSPQMSYYPKNVKKPSDCLVFGCNILIAKWLTVWRLSGNCLDGLLMKVIVRWKDLSEVRNSADRNCRSRLNPENRNMGITTLTFGHLSDSKSAQQGQARCP